MTPSPYISIEQLAYGLRREVEELIAALPTTIDLEKERPSNFSFVERSDGWSVQSEDDVWYQVMVGDKTWKFKPDYSKTIHAERIGKVVLITWSAQIDPETGTILVTPTYSGIEMIKGGNILKMMRALGYDHTRIAGTLGPLYRLGNPHANTAVLSRMGIDVDLTQIWIRRQERDQILAELLLILKLQAGIPDGVQCLLAQEFWREVARHPNDL